MGELFANVKGVSAKDERHIAKNSHLWIFHFFNKINGFTLGNELGKSVTSEYACG